jgi:hypothetical protein
MAIRAWSQPFSPWIDGFPAIAALPDGGFAVAGIQGDLHRFNLLGGSVIATPGSGPNDFQPASFNAESAVALLADGHLALAWQTYFPSGRAGTPAPNRVHVHIADQDGQALTPARNIAPSAPSLLAHADGFALFTRAGTQPVLHLGTADGTLGPSVALSSFPAGTYSAPQAVSLPDGGALAAWGWSGAGLSFRQLDQAFQLAGEERMVSPIATQFDMTVLSTGKVLFVYQPFLLGAFARTYDPATGTLSAEFALDAGPSASRLMITATAEGGFALASQVNTNFSPDIFVRAFDAQFQRMGDVFEMPNMGTDVLRDLVTLGDGRIAVGWSAMSFASYTGPAYLQILDPRDGRVMGSAGADILVGNAGFADHIAGWEGNDQAHGLWGNDTIALGAGDDYASGGADDDWIEGQEGADWIVGDLGNDVVGGGAGDDTLSGGEGHDHLTGGAGFDRLWGGAGNDVFLALRFDGPDILLGEEGLDTAHFADRAISELTAASGLASDGSYWAVFNDGTLWTLFGVEYLAFSDGYRVIA